MLDKITEQANACPFCRRDGGSILAERTGADEWSAVARCHACGANGPVCTRETPGEAIAQARASWRPQSFGAVAAGLVKPGATAGMVSAANRLRLIAEAVEAGTYSDVSGMLVIFRAGTIASVSAHNMPAAEAQNTLRAVLSHTAATATIPMRNHNEH